ncbi:MAG: amidohydrolase family protein [Planctomycetes bacterium]|nr:amidohydrolase family protein [Planctomycetota bacterium]
MSRVALAVALAGATLGCTDYRELVRPGPEAESILVRDVCLFPATGPECFEHVDVLVRGAKIESIRPTGAEPPPGAFVVSGRGRTLLPGLVDVHVHLLASSAPPWRWALPDPEHNLQAYLYAGVTTVCDLGGPIGDLADLREEVESGEIPGPRIFYAGPMLTAPGGHPTGVVEETVPWPVSSLVLSRIAREIETPEEGARAVDEVADGGAGVVKVALDDLPPGAPKLDLDLLRAIVERARARGLPVAAHVRKAPDAVAAARAGVGLLAHGVLGGPLGEDEARILGSLRIRVAPTLASVEGYVALFEGEWKPNALDREIEDPGILADLTTGTDLATREVGPGFTAFLYEMSDHRATWASSVGRLHEAGAVLLAGTDSPLLGAIPGASLHREIRALGECGIPPAEVLLGATSRAASFLDRQGRFGTIEPGRIADLLLVEGNPLVDLSATARIVLVVKEGRIVERFVPEGRLEAAK